MNVAFVGGGTMCEALISGLLGAGVAEASDISVGEPVEARRNALSHGHGVRVHADNAAAVRGSEIVIVSVKPQSLAPVLSELGGSLSDGQVLASIVAGASIRAITGGTGHEAVVRFMPNTPAQVGAGITVWTAAPAVSHNQREVARSVAATLGEEIYVESEDLIDMATALSASGPAYVFAFIEALIDAGVNIGMSRDLASQLTIGTVLGSAKMAGETGMHPAQLRNMVTSPGGTTAAALAELERGGLRHTVLEAVAAAYRRSRQLMGGS